jgi:hypothetical protein
MSNFAIGLPVKRIKYSEVNMYQLIHMAKKTKHEGFPSGGISRYPRLDTVLMVEKALFKHKSDKTVAQIWRSLPKKVMWRTYLTILDYLEYSGKIHIEKDRTVTWLWDPDLYNKLKRKWVEA